MDLRDEVQYWRKLGDQYLLRKYERARKTDILSSWYFCDSIQRLFAHSNGLVKTARNQGLNSIQNLNFLKSFFMKHAGS
jgi:2-polyprenyl-6-methoxyphenol hydroxylase-like FAD-dependent oxidoreductase